MGWEQMAFRFILAVLLSSCFPQPSFLSGTVGESAEVLQLSGWAGSVYPVGHSHQRTLVAAWPTHRHLSHPRHKPATGHRAFALTLPSTWVTVTPDSSLPRSYSSVSFKYHLSGRPSPFTDTPRPSSMLYCSPWHRSSSNVLYIL